MSESTALLLDQSKTQKASENLVSATSHVIRVGLPSQSEPQKHNPEKKAHKPLHTSCISQEMYLPCLIIIQSCYFDYRIYKPFTCSRCVICVLCSIHLISAYAKDHGLFILITHKSLRSENPITWDTSEPCNVVILHTVACATIKQGPKLRPTGRQCD